jgi:hypothetical protein
MDDIAIPLIIACFLGLVTGFIGMMVADAKGRSNGEGFALGFFFSLLGIIVELILPRAEVRNISGQFLDKQNRELRKCPFCAEMVLAEAAVCRYCSRDLPKRNQDKDPIFHSSAIG